MSDTWRPITCEQREQLMAAAGDLLTVYAGSTNYGGNGLVSTTWGTKDGDEEVLRERLWYRPGTWPDPDGAERCEHLLTEAGDRLSGSGRSSRLLMPVAAGRTLVSKAGEQGSTP